MKHVEEKTSTRTTILTMLKMNGALSASQIAQRLDMTEMGVRRHLYQGLQDGVLETIQVKQAMGRPLQLYKLTEQGDERFPKQYHQLLLDLLRESADMDKDGSIVEQLFDARRASMLLRYKPLVEHSDLQERIEQLGRIQDKNGYMVSMEKINEEEWLFHEYNCPIAQVAQVYDDPCRCELDMFRELLQADVERTECLAKQGHRCTYHIRRSQGEMTLEP